MRFSWINKNGIEVESVIIIYLFYPGSKYGETLLIKKN